MYIAVAGHVSAQHADAQRLFQYGISLAPLHESYSASQPFKASQALGQQQTSWGIWLA